MRRRPGRWLLDTFDLKGTEDNPSFSKIAWWALFIASIATGHFSLGFGMLLGAMAFGRSTVGQFFASRSVTANEAVTKVEQTVLAITEKRDAKEGIDPSP